MGEADLFLPPQQRAVLHGKFNHLMQQLDLQLPIARQRLRLAAVLHGNKTGVAQAENKTSNIDQDASQTHSVQEQVDMPAKQDVQLQSAKHPTTDIKGIASEQLNEAMQ